MAQRSPWGRKAGEEGGGVRRTGQTGGPRGRGGVQAARERRARGVSANILQSPPRQVKSGQIEELPVELRCTCRAPPGRGRGASGSRWDPRRNQRADVLAGRRRECLAPARHVPVSARHSTARAVQRSGSACRVLARTAGASCVPWVGVMIAPDSHANGPVDSLLRALVAGRLGRGSRARLR
jgi:hypothetical protein